MKNSEVARHVIDRYKTDLYQAKVQYGSAQSNIDNKIRNHKNWQEEEKNNEGIMGFSSFNNPYSMPTKQDYANVEQTKLKYEEALARYNIILNYFLSFLDDKNV